MNHIYTCYYKNILGMNSRFCEAQDMIDIEISNSSVCIFFFFFIHNH